MPQYKMLLTVEIVFDYQPAEPQNGVIEEMQFHSCTPPYLEHIFNCEEMENVALMDKKLNAQWATVWGKSE